MAQQVITIDTRPFEEMVKKLQQQMGGVPMQEIVDAEVASILSRAAQNTKAAGKTRIRKFYSKKTKNDWYHPIPGVNRRRHWKIEDEYWRAYVTRERQKGRMIVTGSQAEYKKIVKGEQDEAIRRIGLAVQTWVQMADRLGLPLKTRGKKIANARNAKVNGRIIVQDADVNRVVSGHTKAVITMRYANPVGRFANAKGAFYKAMYGRAKYLENNISRGVFDNMASITRAYPGIKVKR